VLLDAQREVVRASIQEQNYEHTLDKPQRLISWILQVLVGAIFVMALIPKLTGDEGSIALFEVLGVEPIGRYAEGIGELVAVILLLNPKTSVIGAVVSLVVITGAIMAHITKLGISIDPVALGRPELSAAEGPTMFIMAVMVFVASLIVVIIRRAQLPIVGSKFSSKAAKA